MLLERMWLSTNTRTTSYISRKSSSMQINSNMGHLLEHLMVHLLEDCTLKARTMVTTIIIIGTVREAGAGAVDSMMAVTKDGYI